MTKVISYFREVIEELRKLAWPSRKDTVRYSAIVIGACAVMAVFFGALDFIFTLGLEKLLTLKG